MADYLQGRVLHVDQHLSNLALNYRPLGLDWWQNAAPIVPVPKETNMILTYNQGDLLRVPSTLRARGGEAQKVGWQVGSGSYGVKNYALKTAIFDEDTANQDVIFASEDKVMRLMDFLSLDAAGRVSNLVNSTSNVGSSTAVASSWTSHTVSRPVDDIFTAIRNVEFATGYRPNRVIFGGKSWNHFSQNDQVINKVFRTALAGAAPMVSVDAARILLQVDEVLLAENVYNTAQEGIAQTLTTQWPDNVLVYYVPDAPSLVQPSFMYFYRWTAPGIPNMTALRLPHDDVHHQQEIEVGYYQDEVITASALGFLITATTSST